MSAGDHPARGAFAALLATVAGSTSVRARLARATGLMLTGAGLQQACAMVASILMARILGKTLFGEFSVIRGTTLLFALLAGGGLGVSATRYVAELRLSDPIRAGRVMRLLFRLAWAMSLTAAVLCVALAKPLAERVIQAGHLAIPVALSSLAIVLSTVGSVQIGVISGCEAFRPIAILTALEGLVVGALSVIGVWAGGVVGGVLGHVAGLLIGFVLRHRQMVLECERAAIPRRARGAFGEWPLIAGFVVPAVLLGIGMQPAEWLARILLARGADGFAEVGLFTAAFGWAQIVVFLPRMVAGPAIPVLTNVLASGDRRTFHRSVLEAAGAVVVVAGVVALAVALASPWIMALYGSAFRGGARVLALVVAGHAIGAVSIVFRSAVLASGRAWSQLLMIAVWGVALIVCFLLLRDRGALALAGSYAAAYTLLVVVQGIAIWRTVRIVGPRVPGAASESEGLLLRGEN